MFNPLLSRRMTATRKTAAQCSLLTWVLGMALDSEGAWKTSTVLPIRILMLNLWQVTIPVGTAPPGVPTEGPAVVVVAHVPAALVGVSRLQLREQMPMMRMLAGRLL